jgi:hypothetical protein
MIPGSVARPACVHCAQQFRRLRKTAIYCSSGCRETFNGFRASKKRTGPNLIRVPPPRIRRIRREVANMRLRGGRTFIDGTAAQTVETGLKRGR